MQRGKHHAAVAVAGPAASSSSQVSSLTQLQHSHSNAAAPERDPEEVSSKGPNHGPAAAGSGSLQALQHAGSAAAADSGVTVQSAQPMQVGKPVCVCVCVCGVKVCVCVCGGG